MDKSMELFRKIVLPAMDSCKTLSNPDFRIIQGAVMQALYAAAKERETEKQSQLPLDTKG